VFEPLSDSRDRKRIFAKQFKQREWVTRTTISLAFVALHLLAALGERSALGASRM
jgi:hypothetical protein